MGEAKKIIVKPIAASDANRLMCALHYSRKVVRNSQVHLGVFLDNKCGGVMQFGPPMNKRASCKLVKDTRWNEFIELNRLAFADWLPRNSESRAIAYAMRWLRKTYPWLKWVLSFADGTQCGDGTIYRASGFVLTGIKKNTGLRINPRTGEIMQTISAYHKFLAKEFRTWEPLMGFQLRYVYFLDRTARERLAVPVLPFSEIKKWGAKMYKGRRATSETIDTPANQAGKGGVAPTVALHFVEGCYDGKI